MADEQTLFPFEIDLQNFGGKHICREHNELASWIEYERNSWDWLRNHGGYNPFSAIAQRQLGPLDSCSQLINQLSQYMLQGQMPQASGVLENIKSILERHYRTEQTGIYSATTKASFVNETKGRKTPRIATLILGAWINADLREAPAHELVEAGIEQVFFEKGIKERAPSERAALAKIATDMQSVLSDGQRIQLEHGQIFSEQEQALIGLTAELQKQFTDAQEARENAWAEKLTDCENKLNHLRKTYDGIMAIQSPVRYWEEKRIRHRNWSWGAGAVTLCAMAIAWALLSTKLDEVKTGAAMSANKLAASQPVIASKVQVAADVSGSWHFDVAVLVLLGTLSFWVIRLLVRVFLSHLHLENDAAERATMARTYLALLRRGKLPEGDDLKTVLAALFRPSGDGIVKDEGMPPSMTDFLTKLGR